MLNPSVTGRREKKRKRFAAVLRRFVRPIARDNRFSGNRSNPYCSGVFETIFMFLMQWKRRRRYINARYSVSTIYFPRRRTTMHVLSTRRRIIDKRYETILFLIIGIFKFKRKRTRHNDYILFNKYENNDESSDW